MIGVADAGGPSRSALAMSNLLVSVISIGVLGGGLALGIRGGAEHPVADRVQFFAFWSYLALTPVLSLIGLIRERGGRSGVTHSVLALIWLVVLVLGAFVHS